MEGTKQKIGTTSELAENGSRIISEVNGQEIAVFRHDDEYYAVANFCIHQSGPLCEGETTGRVTIDDDGWDWTFEDQDRCISCPWHGWTFDITTGKSVKDPSLGVPTYDVTVEDEDIYVIR